MATVVLLIASCTSRDGAGDDPCALVDCPEGQQCVDGGCVLADTVLECVEDSDCADDWLCESGTCVPISPEDPCQSITCGEGEHCVDAVCVPDEQTTPCITDADCADAEVCTNGSCTSLEETEDALALENAAVDFVNLLVGETYPLVAPDPTQSGENDPVDETAADQTDGAEPDSELTDDTGTADGGADRPAPSECTCAWTAAPETAAAFDPADACATGMTPAKAGEFTIAVTVTCGSTEAQVSHPASATVPPTPCTVNDDCDPDEVCAEAICITRTGPVITVLGERPRSPFLVVFDLRLEDAAGQPIHENVTREQFRIFENEVEIDYAETGYAVMPAPNLPLKVVLVLDYTVSMDDAAAIGSMVSAARQFVEADHFTATHHLGVIEFHDRTEEGEGFSVVAPLTRADDEGRGAVSQAIPDEGVLEPGLSRVWDAVARAVSLLGETERQPGEVHAIIFLTDGQDTTSDTSPEAVLSSAVSSDITLYPIGFGHVAERETLLKSLADETGGVYFPAEDANELIDAFADIALDLRGQWTLSYVTQKNTGTVNVRVEFDDGGATDAFATDVAVGNLDGDIHAVVVQVLDRDYDEALDFTSFLLKIAYVPRNIHRLRFFVAHDGSTLTLQGAGGLTPIDNGWVVIAADGMYDLVGPEPLEYGSFGNIGIVSIPGNVTQLQVAHDDSIYDTLPQSKTVVFEGDEHLAPARLTVVADPVDAGTVSVDPDKFAYVRNESVSLVAGAFGDHVFAGWSGGASGSDFIATVTMDGDQTVVAHFLPPCALTVTIDPAGAGTVTAVPDKSSYRYGEVVVLTAVPTSGFTFSAFGGDATGTDTTVIVTMDGDKTVTATFTVTP